MSKGAGSVALKLPRTLSVLGTVSLTLAASVGASSATAEPADATSAISLVDQRTIDIKDSRLIGLSPDGEKIAVSRPARPNPIELCVHDVATLTERVCADISDLDAGLWPDSVVWSPDSEWLAFAELWPQYLVDGDLWLMDASSGALMNLLDDGYSGVLSLESGADSISEEMVTLPTYPTFTPDSAAVTFSLTSVEEDGIKGAAIATVPITGGDAVTLGDSEREELTGEYRGMHWAADGSALYVSLVDQQASGLGPDSGIWVFEADGRHARQLLGVSGPHDWPPRLVVVSPRGERLLVSDLRAAGGRPLCACSLVDGSTGAMKPIEALQPKGHRSTPITGAMLSPDGSLLITISASRGRQVAIQDVATSNEKVLQWEAPEADPSDLAGEVLTWAQNDTILVEGGRRGHGTLIFLDRGS